MSRKQISGDPTIRDAVLRFVGEGRSERFIANALGISRSSVWAIKQSAKAKA